MKIVSTLLLLFVLGCSNGNSNKDYAAGSSMEDIEMMAEPSITKQLTPPPSPQDEQKIIKTARLAFETKDVEAMHKKILQLASQYKGLVQNDNSGKDYNRIYKNMTVRIPTENFQQFIDGISEGVAYFDQKDISRQDVSEEFVDLEARLKAKRVLEERYLELLKKANKVEEMLQIERELSNIREEIEAKQGRLQYLQSQVSMSTVNIEFYKTTAETGITQSYGQKMKNALQGGWNGISVFFLGILYLWPLFLVAIIVVIILRIFLKKRKPKNPKN
jgi:plasmid stabilization system protein ParE